MGIWQRPRTIVAGVTLLASGVIAADDEVAVGPGLEFTPSELIVQVGDKVRWEWMGGLHNVESGVDGVHDGIFRSGDPTDEEGTTFEVTFDQDFLNRFPSEGNVYPYYSATAFDQGMVGTIIVDDPCPVDITGDGEVDVEDVLALLAAWGKNPGHPADFNGDGVVDVVDLLVVLASYGQCEAG